MKRIFLIPVLLIMACNSSTDENAITQSISDSSGEIKAGKNDNSNLSGCYISILKRDTANLKLTVLGNEVSGDLIYDRFEKDGNVGTINGKIQDDLVIADYTFQSEGMSSVKQIVFKIQNGQLIEGFGDIVMEGDSAVFKNISDLKYQSEQPFTKADCK